MPSKRRSIRGGTLGEVDEEQFGGELDVSSVELQTGAGPREWLTSIIGESDVLTVPGRGSGEQRDMLDARSSPIRVSGGDGPAQSRTSVVVWESPPSTTTSPLTDPDWDGVRDSEAEDDG